MRHVITGAGNLRQKNIARHHHVFGATGDAAQTEPQTFIAMSEADGPENLVLRYLRSIDGRLARIGEAGVPVLRRDALATLSEIVLAEEEIRIINMHRNLERYLGIEPGGRIT